MTLKRPSYKVTWLVGCFYYIQRH